MESRRAGESSASTDPTGEAREPTSSSLADSLASLQSLSASSFDLRPSTATALKVVLQHAKADRTEFVAAAADVAEVACSMLRGVRAARVDASASDEPEHSPLPTLVLSLRVLKVACGAFADRWQAAESGLPEANHSVDWLLDRLDSTSPSPRWATDGTLQPVLRVALNALASIIGAVPVGAGHPGCRGRLELWRDWVRPRWARLLRAAGGEASCVDAIAKVLHACAEGDERVRADLHSRVQKAEGGGGGGGEGGGGSSGGSVLLDLVEASVTASPLIPTLEGAVASLCHLLVRRDGLPVVYSSLGHRRPHCEGSAQPAGVVVPPSQPQLLLLESDLLMRRERPATGAPGAPEREADGAGDGVDAGSAEPGRVVASQPGGSEAAWLQALVCEASRACEQCGSHCDGAAAHPWLQAGQLALALLAERREAAGEAAGEIPALRDAEFDGLLARLARVGSDGTADEGPAVAAQLPGIRQVASALLGGAARCAEAQGGTNEPPPPSSPLSLCLVTTGKERDPSLGVAARALSDELCACGRGVRARFVEREEQTLVKMLDAAREAVGVLVVSSAGTLLRMRDGGEMRLHGGIGVLRLRNVLGGGEDKLISACEIRRGDTFVDATGGQLQDAIVAAAAVGGEGQVIAFEASPLLYAVQSGRPVSSGDDDVDAMLRRIRVRLGDHTSLLASMADESADVVYFDPMFRKPTKSSDGFESVLRRLACASELSVDAVEQAKRVARRAVVVMDQAGGVELERLGLEVVHAGNKKRYGVWRRS